MVFDHKIRLRRDALGFGATLRTAYPNATIVLASGCFDGLHPGHARYLIEAKKPFAEQRRILVVGVNEDATVRLLKGPGKPRFTLEDRMSLLASLEVVDYVLGFPEPDARMLIRDLRPQVFTKGPDYTDVSVLELGVCRAIGCAIEICGHTEATRRGEPKAECSADITAP